MTTKKLGMLFFFLGSMYLVAQENIALNKPVTVDSERNDYYHKSKAVDGNNVGNETRWISLETDWPHWIEVDFEGTYAVSQLKFWTGYNGYNDPVTYRFEVWNGSDWTTVVDGSDNTLAIVDESFTAVTTNKVRLFATGSTGNNFFKLYEIEVYGVPSSDSVGSGGVGDSGNSVSSQYINAIRGVFDASETSDPNRWIPLTIGREWDTDRRNFEFVVAPEDNSREYLAFGINDENKVGRYNITVTPDLTSVSAKTPNNVEVFKIATDQRDNKNFSFLQIPNPNTKVIFGGYGDYLPNEDYKLIVKDGTALIEDGIFTNGRVSIGTTEDDPEYSLTVNGKIHTKEVNIDLEGVLAPDYVFYKDYDLKTLDEVQNHIDAKGHLPNIPSAAEMEKNGINLRDMNLKLLEKIEELTLYTLSQEKDIKTQKQENAALKNRLERLEKLIIKE